MSRTTGAALAAIVLAFGGRAHALDPNQCVAESDAGQELRLAGRLVTARAHFAACRAVDCPKMVRDACAEWFAEVDRVVPTVVVAVHEPGGRDAVAARVSLDDAPIPLDGRPWPLDPGPHHLHATTTDGRAIDEDIVARASERDRVVSMVLPPPPAKRVTPWPGIAVALGAGVAWGVFAGLAIEGANLYAAASTCAPRCQPGAYDDSNRWFVAADVALGVAAVATVVSVILFATHRYSVPSALGPTPVLTF